MKKKQDLTAQVILKSGSGKKLEKSSRITAKKVSSIRPTKETIKKAATVLKKAGFEVESAETTLSIHSSIDVFEKYFNTTVTDKTNVRGVTYFECDEPHIPEELKSLVDSVVLPHPPEFF